MTSSKTTSPRKLAKKAMKVFRKNQVKMMEGMIRPKPKWLPWRVYLFLLGMFINIEK